LLPHLIEAMHRARGVIIVTQSGSGQLEWTWGPSANVRNADVRSFRGQAGRTRIQILVVGRVEVRLVRYSYRLGTEGLAVSVTAMLVAPGERVRKVLVECLVARINGVVSGIAGRELMGKRVIRARGAIGVDDAERHQVPYGLALARDIGSEDVIEAAILSKHHNHVLDGRGRRMLLRLADH